MRSASNLISAHGPEERTLGRGTDSPVSSMVTRSLFSPSSRAPGNSRPRELSSCLAMVHQPLRYTVCDMFSERFLSGLVAVAVIALTVGFLALVDPEEEQIVSGDGVLTVTGLARQTQPFTIEPNLSEVKTPLIGKSYLVAPDEVTLDEPAILSFSLDHVPASQAMGVFRYRPDLLMWERVEPVVSHTDSVLAVQTAQLGGFALGQMETVPAPQFIATYEALRGMAPDNAVGYETVVGYNRHGDETIRLYDLGESGGCGGAVRVGDAEQSSRLLREVSLDMNDQPTTVVFTFVTRWFTSSTGGCAAGEELRPLSEYDILQQN